MKTNHLHQQKRVLLLQFLSSVFLIGVSITTANAQVYYGHDDNGNRISIGTTPASHAPKRHKSDTTKDSNTVAQKHGINVYPNPTSGEVTVDISSFQPCGNALVYLQDASGNELLAQKATSSPVLINLTSYNQGLYYVKVIICDDQVSYKVIKENPGN